MNVCFYNVLSCRGRFSPKSSKHLGHATACCDTSCDATFFGRFQLDKHEPEHGSIRGPLAERLLGKWAETASTLDLNGSPVVRATSLSAKETYQGVKRKPNAASWLMPKNTRPRIAKGR